MARTLYFLLTVFHLILIISKCSVEPYSYVGSTTSGTRVFYNNSNTALSQGIPSPSFTINYDVPKPSSPKLLIGLHSYEQRGNMGNTYFKLSILSNTLTSFQIQTMAAGSSLVYLIVVWFISLEDAGNAAYLIPFQYNSLSTVSTGIGARTETKACNFYIQTNGNTLNSNYSLNKAFVYLHGFQMQSLGNCYISLTISLQNSISYDINIKTKFDCRVQYVKGVSLLVNTGRFITQNIYLYQQSIQFNSSIPIINSPSHFSSFGHTFLGVFTIKAQNTQVSGAIMRFNLYNTNNTLGMLYSSVVTSIQYMYLFIGANQCMSSYPYFQDSTKSSCVAQCQGTQTQFPVGNVCLSCLQPCSSCYSLASNCTSCINGYELQVNQCHQKIIIVVQSESKLYLIGLLGLIPIGIILLYLFLKKRNYLINQSDIAVQPSIDIS